MAGEPDFSRVEYNERILLEENLDAFEKYFPGLKGMPESMSEIRLNPMTRRDWAGLVALYASESDESPTANKLAEFSGLEDIGRLQYRLKRAYGPYIERIPEVQGAKGGKLRYRIKNSYGPFVEMEPEFKGAEIGRFLKDVGQSDTNLFAFAGRGIDIGSADVVKGIWLPAEIDERLAWLAGMASISSYSEGKTYKGGEVANSYKRFIMSFQRGDKDLIELEFLPIFEELFNYSPSVEFAEGPVKIKSRNFDSKRYAARISPKSIVSYLKDYLGICPKQEERTILFEDESLRKAFIGGVIDRTGYYSYRRKKPFIELGIPLKYPRIAEELAEFFNRKFDDSGEAYRLQLFVGKELPEKIEEFCLRDPKWYLPFFPKTF